MAGLLTLMLVLGGCGTHEATTQKAPPVTVRRPAREPVQDYVELTGTVASYRTVDLVARVTGYLQSIHFKDGAWVEAGQLLFIIEPESYQQQLALAQASLDRARAEYERQLGLLKENATSTANVERWLSERDQAAAQVELAKLNLSYTRVTAPFPGRIGRHLVDVGNLVGPGVNTKLATLDQLVPIYINFNLNEREALRLRDLMRQHGVEPGSGVGTTPVLLGLQNQEGYPYAAKLDFVDTGVSPGSGTILMRATYTNTDQALLPGLFARVRIPVGPPQPMLVVPASALANDQEGDYLLVADATDTVVRRTVVKGPPTSEGCAIRSGLSAEDRVIVRGLMQAQPGEKIKPVTESGPGPAPGPKEPSTGGAGAAAAERSESRYPKGAEQTASGYRMGFVPARFSAFLFSLLPVPEVRLPAAPQNPVRGGLFIAPRVRWSSQTPSGVTCSWFLGQVTPTGFGGGKVDGFLQTGHPYGVFPRKHARFIIWASQSCSCEMWARISAEALGYCRMPLRGNTNWWRPASTCS